MKVMNGILLLQIFWFFVTSSADSDSVYERSNTLYNPRISYSRYPYNNFYSVYNRGYNREYYNRGYYNRGYNRYQSGFGGLLGILGGLGFGGYNRVYSGYGSGISTNIFGVDSIINQNQNYHSNNNYYDDHSSNFYHGSDFSDGSAGEGNSDVHDDDGLSNSDTDNVGSDNEAIGDTDVGEADFSDGGDGDVGDSGDT